MKLSFSEAKKKVEGESINGVVFVKTYEVKIAKSGKKYAQGMLVDGAETIPYKVWSDALEAFSSILKISPILNINGKINVFNDTVSVIISSAENGDNLFSTKDFISGYDKAETEEKFWEITKRLLSPEKFEILTTILADDVKDRFFLEYAGMTMHDACPTGVARHTLKMLYLTETLLNNDERLTQYKDLVVLGVALHDIGKISEMKDGVYQPNSFVTHRTFGAEFLYKNKYTIVLNSSENFYYQLLAIMQGHHGEYEEPCKTVATQIVHLIDMLESGVTGMLDRIAADNLSEEASGEKCITFPAKLYI